MFLFKKELKHKEVKIFNLAATSSPFKSDVGFDSAYPNFFALFKTSLKFLFFRLKIPSVKKYLSDLGKLKFVIVNMF